MISISIVITLISAAVLGLELVLMRTLAIGHWHHFAYLIISTALLGFGCSGTVVTLTQNTLRKHWQISAWLCCLCLMLTAPLSFWLAQMIPFNQLQLVWDIRQLFYLLGYYLLFFIPFFFGGACVCLLFTAHTKISHKLYFFNMAGSGLGSIGLVLLMYGISPEKLLLVISGLAMAAAVICACRMSVKTIVLTGLLGMIVFGIFTDERLLKLSIRVSENKSLVFYTSLPDSQTITTTYSPVSRLDIIQASAIRFVPGLSIGYTGPIPEQNLLLIDADSSSILNRFNSLADLQCYDYITSALPYHLLHQPSVCIIGSAGGSDIAQALFEQAAAITAVEPDRKLLDLLKGEHSRFVSDIYNHPRVQTASIQPRTFLQNTTARFDIIQFPAGDSFGSGPVGLYALNETHLYTIEAITKALDKLTDHGLLCITRGLKMPPRDNLKMIATVNEALLALGVAKPENNIIVIRSWATATIVAGPTPFSADQVTATRQFCKDRRFDIVHLTGLTENEVNTRHKLSQPFYHNAAKEILSDSAEDFYNDYPYNIRPATDNRPYFFDFLKLKTIKTLIRSMPDRWLPYSEWGFFILAATGIQAVVISTLLIVLPLAISKPLKTASKNRVPTFAYFLLLGLSYMFLEMGYIQKMTLLIGVPVYGIAITLLVFLVFSGLGSLSSVRIFHSPYKRISGSIAMVLVIGVADMLLFHYCFDFFLGLSLMLRIVAGVCICGPLAFFMGFPFPTGLSQVNERNSPLVPWAWAINGFASVAAAVLGTTAAILFGFNAVTATALLLYLIAAITARRICH